MSLKAIETPGDGNRSASHCFAPGIKVSEPVSFKSFILFRRHIHPYFFLLGVIGGVIANLATVLLIGHPAEFVVKSGVVLTIIATAVFIRPTHLSLKPFEVLVPLSALLALAMLSITYNGNPAFGFLRWVLVAVYFWAVARIAWQAPGTRDRAISLIAGLTVAGGVFALYVYKFSAIHSNFGTRSSVEFLHPNTQAFICAGTASMAVALFILCRNRLFRIVLGGIFLLSTWGLIITASRMPMLALLAGAAVVVTIRYGYGSPGRKLALIFALILGTLLLYLVTTFLLEDRFYDYMRFNNIEHGSGRLETFSFVIDEMFHPPIMPLGLGPGAGAPYLLDKMSLSSAHNALLQAVVDLGPLGALPFLWLLAVAGMRALKMQNRYPVEIAIFTGLLIFAFVRSMGEQELLGLGNSFDLTLPLVLSKLWQSRYWPDLEALGKQDDKNGKPTPTIQRGSIWRKPLEQEIR